MDLQNIYRSEDKKQLISGSEIVNVRSSITGTGPSTLYKIYFYVRNIGWVLMASDPDPAVIEDAMYTLMGYMGNETQNKSLEFPWA